jgi:hypothetical protein
MVPASKLRLPFMAFRAIYDPQFDEERGTEGDGYDSEELDEKHLHVAVQLYKAYMKTKANLMNMETSNQLLQEVESDAIMHKGDDFIMADSSIVPR